MSIALHLVALTGWVLLVLWIGRVREALPHDRQFTIAIVLIVAADLARSWLL